MKWYYRLRLWCLDIRHGFKCREMGDLISEINELKEKMTRFETKLGIISRKWR